MISRIFKKASEGGQAGYTLIEIVTALILLGILGAVAIPKYFDLQEEAAATKCQYHRSLVLKTLYQRWALNKIDASVFDGQLDDAINEVMKELGGDGCKNHGACEKLCPSGGTYDVTYDKSDSMPLFAVKCSVETHGGSSGTYDPDKVITIDTIEKMVKWLVGDGTTNQAFYNQVVDGYSIDKYFTDDAGNGGQGVIDSEDADSKIANFVNQALKAAGFDTDDVIWQLERKTANPSRDAQGRWHSILTLTVADKNDSNPTSAKTRVFTTDIYYRANEDKGAPVDRFVRQAETSGTADISSGKLKPKA